MDASTTASTMDHEDARIVSWFLTGLRREAIRLAKKQKRLLEHELLILDELLRKNPEDEELQMLDVLTAKNDTLAEVESTLFLEEVLSLLTPDQKKVINATVLEGLTERELASEMGIARQSVNKLKERALNRLRKHLVLDEPTLQVTSSRTNDTHATGQ